MGLTPGWQAILLPCLFAAAFLVAALALGFKIPWTHSGHWWTTVLVVIADVVRGMLILVLVSVLLPAASLFAVSSVDNVYQRTQHHQQEGYDLPKLTIHIPWAYMKEHGLTLADLRTWVAFGEVFPSTNTAFAGWPDGKIDPRRGVLAGIAQHSIVVLVNYPKLGMDETTAFPYIFDQLYKQGLRNVVLIGSSLGSQRAERFRVWLEYKAPTRLLGSIQAVVYLFPFGNISQVKSAVARSGMRAHKPCSGGRPYDSAWKDLLAEEFAPENPADRARAESEGWARQYDAIRGDVTGYDGNVCVNFNHIVSGTAFDTGPVYTAYPVFVLSCPVDADDVLDAAAALQMMRLMFPDMPEANIRYTLPAGHGMLAERGPQIRVFIDAIDAELGPIR